MPARFTYHGSPFAQQIQQQGFKSGAPTNSLSLGSKPITFADLFQQGPKTFTSTSPNVASMYGKNVPVVSSTRNLSLPSGGINSTGVRFGNEVVQTPGQATKGMNIANKALERSARGVSPTATRLAGGATVSGLGGSTPGNLGIKALSTLASLHAQAAFFTLGSTPANADEANMGLEDFRALAEAEGMTYGSSPITSSPFVDAGRDFSMFDQARMGQARMGDAVSGTNVQGMDYEMDPAAQEGFLNPNIQPSQNMFQRAGNFINDLDLEDYLPFIGQKSLTGMMGRGIGNLFQNIAPARYGTSQRAYNALSPQGRSAVGDIYGPRGIMSGYNAVSAFGRGPVGAIDARLDKLGTRRAPPTDLSRQRARDLFAAREKIMQTTLDSDSKYTGPTSSPRGQKAGVMDDDPFATGPSGTTGTSSKIVCTMMNDSYGFGNFRNKIWLKHSKDLPKEYEVGYHKIFLPLVKFAKEEGKLNKVVKKTLEHIARHRTLDLKQEMKGKTHTLGRVYRKILEPICFLVGKASMFVRRR